MHDCRSVGNWFAATSSGTFVRASQHAGTAPYIQEIAKNKVLQIRQALGMTIECLEGSVWVTQDGDTRDVVLDAGHIYKVDRQQRTLIQALDSARVRLIR